MNSPKVSITMSVYNGERYLKASVESILAQTFTDFEFLIVNDGSTDRSLEILQSYKDPRVKIIDNGSNLGLVKSLNRSMVEAKGEYIARHDADDLAHSERLAQQVAFLDEHPHVGLLGCSYWLITEDNQIISLQSLPTENDELQKKLLWANHFCHPAAIMRKCHLNAVGGYREEFVTAQDYDLWLRLAEQCEIANLPDPLVAYRRHSASKIMQEDTSFRVQYGLMAQKHAMERRRNTLKKRNNQLIKEHLALGYLAISCNEFLLGLKEEAIQHLELAFKSDINCLRRGGFKETVKTCLTYSAVSWFGWQRSVDTLELILVSLPSIAEDLLQHKATMLADMYRHMAFEAYRRNEFDLVRSNLFKAWQYDPSQLWANRGIISIFVETLIGHHLMAYLRKLVSRWSFSNDLKQFSQSTPWFVKEYK